MHLLNSVLKWNLILFALVILGAGQAFGDTGAEAQPTASGETTVAEKPLPLWELGLGAAGARLPHYIGSDEYKNYAYPLVYFIYRGDILRADRDGIRGIFYKGEKFETSLSFWGNPPIPDDNDARQGMPELDAIGEVGPSLRYDLYRYKQQDRLYLQAALRTAWSIDFQGGLDIETKYEGLFGSIGLRLQNRSWLARQQMSFRFNAALQFANSSYNDYFYGVADAFATANRPAYSADGGYSGFSLSTSLFKRLSDRFGVGCYARWNNINGAAFEDSPLVREKNNYAIGSVLIWKLAVSRQPAP